MAIIISSGFLKKKKIDSMSQFIMRKIAFWYLFLKFYRIIQHDEPDHYLAMLFERSHMLKVDFGVLLLLFTKE